jgi:acylphosphatase
VRITVRGRVQGVWFRGSARERAQALGLLGWARNRADGSVEILVQGPRAPVENLVDWCRQGPPGARVASLAREEEAPGEELREFHVRG